MSKVFGHKYELYIGDSPKLIDKHTEPSAYTTDNALIFPIAHKTSSTPTGGEDYRTVGTSFIKITDPVQMVAKVTYSEAKTSGTSPQSASINLYNLSPKTLEQINTDSIVILNAGYESKGEKEQPPLSLAFSGTVDHISTQQSGAEMITTLLCTEGGSAVKSIRFTKSYPAGRTYAFLLEQMIKEFADNGIPLGSFSKTDRTSTSVQEQSVFSGKLSKCLTDLCSGINYVWYISRGKLHIQPKDLPRRVDFLEVNPENIIEKIHPIKNKVGMATTDPVSTLKGIKFSTFFNGEVGLESYVRIAKGDFAGQYGVKKLDLHLNWADGPWTMTITTEEVKT